MRWLEQQSALNSEGFTTAARLISIGVGKLKSSPNQRIAVIELKTIEIKEAFGIADDFEAFIVKYFIIFANLAGVFKVHHVGHSRTAAVANSHPQAEVFTSRLLAEFENVFEGGWGK